MKKKLSIIAIFCICGVVNSFCNENPLFLFDYSRELNIDSMKSVLEKNGYTARNVEETIIGNDLFGNHFDSSTMV